MSTQPLGQMIIELGLNESNFTRGMKGINQQLKTSMTEMKAHLSVMGQSGSEIDKLKVKQTGLTSVVDAQNKKVALAKEKYDACKAAVEGNAQATQQQKDALIRAQNEYVRAIGDLGTYEQQLKEVNIQLTAMQTGMYQVGASMEQFGQRLMKIGDFVANVGQKLTIGITTPIIALGTYVIKTAAEFDSAMSEVSAVSGAVGEDFDRLREKAREMGEKTKFSATESAKAMNYMAMAGWKTGDMLDGIEGIMSLAAASGESLATTSDIVTDALTGFGESAAESGRLADIMAAASSNANTNVGLMGETFKYCTPIAGALGFSMEETAEAIGLMANSGIKGSMAGTAMRSMMNNLAGSVKLTAASFGDMTIETQNSDGSMRDLNGILAECRTAFSQMTEAERVLNAESVVGKNAMSGFLAVMNAAPADIEKLNTAILNCEGTAASMAETMQDNLNGQITILKSQTDELAIAFGDILMPKIRGIVTVAQDFVDRLNKLDDGTKNAVINVGLFTAAVGPAVLIVGKLTSGIGSVVTGIGKGLQSFTLWAAKITTTTTATASQTVATATATATTEVNTAASIKNTSALLAKTAKVIADTAASKAHTIAEKARNVVVKAGNGELVAQVTTMNAAMATKISDTAATAAHTVAEKARNIAVVASTSSFSFQTVATVAQTVATNACAVATGLLSAALKLLSGPIGWIIAAVTALVAGIIAVVKWFTKDTEAAKKMKAETKELADANNALVESLGSSKDAYENNVKSIKAETGASKTLADKVSELSKIENKTAKQKKELATYVDMLRNSTEGLNIQYDEQTDNLNMATEQIYLQIGALEKQAEAQAAQDRMTEILREQIIANEQLTQVQKKVVEATENGNLKNSERKKIIADLTLQEETLQMQLESLGESLAYVTDVIIQSTEEEANAVTENTQTIMEAYGSLANAYEDLGERQQTALDNILGAYETMTSKLTDLTTKIELDSETTWAKIQENQQDTIEKTKEFSELYAQLITAGVSESYLNAIGATGPESIPLLKEMLSQGTDTILNSQADWHDAYGVIGNTLVDSLKLDSSVEDAIKGYIMGESGVLGTFQNTIATADLDGLGKSITEGLSSGILESTDNAVNAATEMADATTTAAMEAWDINSPSKVFAEMGRYLVAGLIEGISGEGGTVSAAFESVVPNAIDAINKSLSSAMPGIKTTFQTGFQESATAVQNQVNKISLDVKTGLATIQTTAKLGINVFKTTIVNGYTEATTQTKTQTDLMANNNQSAIDKINQNTKSGLDTYRQTFVAGMNTVQETTKSTTESITNTLNISEKLRQLGKNAMEGFRNGMAEMAAPVLAKAKEIADNVANTIAKSLDIHSPSRVTKKLGIHTIQGFADGIESMENRVEATTRHMTDSVKETLSKVVLPESAIELTDKATAIQSMSRVNQLQEKTQTVKNEEGKNEVQTLMNQLLSGNKKMIELLQLIAEKELVVDKESMVSGVDIELGKKQILKVRRA